MASPQRPFWLAQALADDPATLPPLAGDTDADVCIVGGGYTGLWTALQIKQQAPRLDVVILEADTCGAGASGRNGGCMLSWATKFLTLQRLFGELEAIRLVRASEDAIGEIEAFTREHGIDCDLRRDGVLYTATNAAQLGSADGVIAELERRGLNTYTTLQADEVARRAGSRRHLGGVFSPHGATLQPGKLVRACDASRWRWACASTSDRRCRRSKPPKCRGSVRPGAGARRKVVLALNAWMATAFPQFKRHIVVVSSDMVITEALPERLARTGLTNGVAVLDSRTFVYYYHRTGDGRIMLGKGGNTFAYDARILPVFDQPSPYLGPMTKALAEFFPELADVPVAASWNGASDRSTTGLPFFGRLNRHPAVFYGFGYSGNGVAPTFLGGQILSSLALGQDNPWTRSGLAQGRAASFRPTLSLRGQPGRAQRHPPTGECPGSQPLALVLRPCLAGLADAAGRRTIPDRGERSSKRCAFSNPGRPLVGTGESRCSCLKASSTRRRRR